MSQDRSSQDRSSQDMLSQDRSSQVSLSQDRLSQNRSSKDRSSQDRSGQVHLRMEFDSGVGPTCLFVIFFYNQGTPNPGTGELCSDHLNQNIAFVPFIFYCFFP